MLHMALTFLIIALVVGVLGFTGTHVEVAESAKKLCVVFIVLFFVSLITHGVLQSSDELHP